MARVRDQLSELYPGWPADKVGQIVSECPAQAVVPYLYGEVRQLITAPIAAGHEVIIVSSSGHEVVAPIAVLLGARRSSPPG
jgi:phosphoserine phosphatase